METSKKIKIILILPVLTLLLVLKLGLLGFPFNTLGFVFFFVPGIFLLDFISLKKKIKLKILDKLMLSFMISVILNIILVTALVFFHRTEYFHYTVFASVLSFFFLDFFSDKRKHRKLKIDFGDREFQIMVFFVVFLCFFMVFENYQIIGWEDGYYYFYDSYNFLKNGVMNSRFGYTTTMSFFQALMGSDIQVGRAISVLLWAMMIPLTYKLGNLINEKTGIVSALLISINPVLFWYNTSIRADVLAALFGALFIYLFYVTFRENDKNFLAFSLVAFLLSIIYKPTAMVFLIPVVYLCYKNRKMKKKIKYFFAGFIPLLAVFLYYGYSFLPNTIMNNFSNLVNPSALAYRINEMVLSPNYFSPVVIFLVLFGTFSILMKKNRIGIYLLLSVSAVVGFFVLVPWAKGARHVMIIFPLLSVIGSSFMFSSEKNGKEKSVLLFLAAAVATFLIPWNGVPYIEVDMELTKMLNYVSLIGIISFLSLKIDPRKNKKTMTIFLIFSIVASSLMLGCHIKNQRHGSDIYLREAGEWLKNNSPENSVIMSNAFYSLPPYSGYRETVKPPEKEELFQEEIWKTNYLVVMNIFPLRHYENWPYLTDYMRKQKSLPEMKLCYEKYGVDTTIGGEEDIMITIYKIEKR